MTEEILGIRKPRRIGWFARLIWYKYKPERQYFVKSGLSIVECNSNEWPILLNADPGEHHVILVSDKTVQSMIDFINIVFTGTNTPIDISDDRFKKNGTEFHAGDKIEIWQKRGHWYFNQRGRGMPRVYLEDEEWALLARIFNHILNTRNTHPTSIPHEGEMQ